ncbi:unnamed protein product [Larinioides sclopetarius]|uniref:Secreted protein n=1 Tax=Larinioides sclopetarius TaxID=280406 RepID=A0AAV2A9X9_9ARAC
MIVAFCTSYHPTISCVLDVTLPVCVCFLCLCVDLAREIPRMPAHMVHLCLRHNRRSRRTGENPVDSLETGTEARVPQTLPSRCTIAINVPYASCAVQCVLVYSMYHCTP